MVVSEETQEVATDPANASMRRRRLRCVNATVAAAAASEVVADGEQEVDAARRSRSAVVDSAVAWEVVVSEAAQAAAVPANAAAVAGAAAGVVVVSEPAQAAAAPENASVGVAAAGEEVVIAAVAWAGAAPWWAANARLHAVAMAAALWARPRTVLGKTAAA